MKFRKKPVVIEAEPYREGLEDGWNCYEVLTWRFLGYYKNGVPYPRSKRVPVIETLEGNHEITPTDWIVIGIKGERYPVKRDIFEMTYESVDSPKYTDDLIEKLSEEVHNAWMKEKIEQGFHAPIDCEVNEQIKNAGYPPKKDKFDPLCKKCHTDLYPYLELPENIKEYDRVTVRAVLSAMEKLGL